MRNFSAATLQLVTLFIILLAPLAGRAAPLYTVTSLPNIDFSVTGMNNAGQIVGFAGNGAGAIHTVLYSDGVLTDLGDFGGKDSYGTAINDAGAITGSILTASGEQHAFLYRDGALLDLGAGTAGYGINSQGDVVGSRQTTNGLAGFVFRNGTLTELGHPGTAAESVAVAINDDGAVVGDATTGAASSSATRHPFVYRDGTMHDLGVPGNHAFNGVVAINNAGQIAGYSGNADAYTNALLWDSGILRDLGGFGNEGLLDIHDLNVHGTLVGTAFTEDEGLTPFISLGDVLVDLNTLVDPALGWRLSSAYANNDLGQIVGYGCRDDACGLVRLDLAGAVPEPGTAMLLATGLLVLPAARRRMTLTLAQMDRHARCTG